MRQVGQVCCLWNQERRQLWGDEGGTGEILQQHFKRTAISRHLHVCLQCALTMRLTWSGICDYRVVSWLL